MDKPVKTPGGRAALVLLALRLLTAVFLLAPWAGFDEPYHQGYSEYFAAHARWPGFRQIELPARIPDAMRRWPLPPVYARDLGARTYGETSEANSRSPTAFRDTNYETQQSPLYYLGTGLLLRLVPGIDPMTELYLLRILNAALAFGVGVVLLKASRPLGLGWGPVALLAFVPGFAIAMCRASNDALCALLIGIATLGAVALKSGPRSTTGCAAAGLAPWVKLYGLAVLPATLIREISRHDASAALRCLRALLVVLPPLALGVASLMIFGTPVPLQYNVRSAGPARIADVPWIRDAWAVAKTHVWVSGMSFLVFPTVIYVLPVLFLGAGAVLTLRHSLRLPAVRIAAAHLSVFAVGLCYHNWRAFSYYGGPGATGGWYLWAVAVPEMLLISYGVLRDDRLRGLVPWALLMFLILSVAGDAALFLDAAGLLRRTPRGHIAGVLPASFAQGRVAFLASRPVPIAVLAASFAAASWVVAILVWARAHRSRGGTASAETISI